MEKAVEADLAVAAAAAVFVKLAIVAAILCNTMLYLQFINSTKEGITEKDRQLSEPTDQWADPQGSKFVPPTHSGLLQKSGQNPFVITATFMGLPAYLPRNYFPNVFCISLG